MLYLALFLFGLTGSLHCVGMCSPLISIACLNQSSNSMMPTLAVYHFGRIFTYSLLGGFIGLIGGLSFTLGLQLYISAAMALILMFYSIAMIFNLRVPYLGNAGFSFTSIYNKILKRNSSYTTLLLGMLNGILPCGLVYGAMAMAFLNHSVVEGMMSMFLFGLGTIPILFLVAFGAKIKSIKHLLINTKLQYHILLLSSVYIIYKVSQIQLPAQTQHWQSIVNPIMCHQ